MAFRDNFFNAYSLVPVNPRQPGGVSWSLENSVDSGLRLDRQILQSLCDNLRSAIMSGAVRVATSSADCSTQLQKEMRTQADSAIPNLARTMGDTVAAIQQVCDYLGGPLCEMRWVAEKTAATSQKPLKEMMYALDGSSRQFYQQAVRCYEMVETGLARERLMRALDGNRTNYFAYQYLGFLAVRDENSREALKQFDLARKFAENKYHLGLALGHLARCYDAMGEPDRAMEAANNAAQGYPESAKFWHEAAIFQLKGGEHESAIASLARAISLDLMYWSVGLAYPGFQEILSEVGEVLDELREKQRETTQAVLDDFRSTLSSLRAMSIPEETFTSASRLGECEAQMETENVFTLREIILSSNEAHRLVLSAAMHAIDQKAAANRNAMSQAQNTHRMEVGGVRRELAAIQEELAETKESSTVEGCLMVVGIVAAAFSFIMLFVMSQDRTLAVLGLAGSVLVVITGWLWKPIVRTFTSGGAAGKARTKLLERQKAVQKQVDEAEGELAEIVARFDAELDELKLAREKCQIKAKALDPNARAS